MRKLTLLIGIIIFFFSQAKGQLSFNLLHTNLLNNFNTNSPFVYENYITSFKSTFFQGQIIIGSNQKKTHFKIHKIEFDEKNVVESTFEIEYPDILKQYIKNGALKINNSYEINKDEFDVFVENKVLISFKIRNSKIYIKSIIDIYKKFDESFKYFYHIGKYYAGFGKINISKQCVISKKIDTIGLYIYNNKLKLKKYFLLPDFEQCFINYGSTKYIDYYDKKILITSPTKFIITIFDIESLDTVRFDLKTNINFNFKIIDSKTEISIKNLYPGNFTGDRLSTYFKLDTINFIKKCFFINNSRIGFIITKKTNEKNFEYVFSYFDFTNNLFSNIDSNLKIFNKFNNKIVKNEDFPVELYHMNFNISLPYFFVYGYDMYDSLIGKTLSEFIMPDVNNWETYKLKYYILKSNL
ncbi:MAG: hypothetical protein IT243_01180 [Bacteroidia bacterium]|nr:hypothetical protein [Bacteroidia bacterium]